ncbi:MAG TPA: DNA translocase FtsK 4TM domain-containing protein, partial [Xanthobacteraceae bacterium]|nr:DNA translocase FtsK 4TM domain-containing protein [Xanthobacteraceae bacterium]
MSMIDRSLDGMASLSGHLGALLKRRLREVGGIALLSLAMMATLALATWSVQDPSLSHATNVPVRNLLGHPGAITADLLMQLLGLGSLALLLPIAIWGYRLLGHRPLSRERLRMLLWLFGAVLAAAFASCLPRSAHWPLPCGLGGVIGDAILRLPTQLFGVPMVGANRLAATIVLGIAALVAFAGAAGIIWRDAADDDDEEDKAVDEDDDSGWISLGRLMHAVLSFRARIARLFRRRTVTQAAPRPAAPRRIEPRFDAPSVQYAGDEPDDVAEEADEAEPRAPRKPRA